MLPRVPQGDGEAHKPRVAVTAAMAAANLGAQGMHDSVHDAPAVGAMYSFGLAPRAGSRENNFRHRSLSTSRETDRSSNWPCVGTSPGSRR